MALLHPPSISKGMRPPIQAYRGTESEDGSSKVNKQTSVLTILKLSTDTGTCDTAIMASPLAGRKLKYCNTLCSLEGANVNEWHLHGLHHFDTPLLCEVSREA